MKIKIGFIADFFDYDLNGGAELNDGVLIKYLEEYCEINTCKSNLVTSEFINNNDKFIVSNFVGLQDNVKKQLERKNYIIYEHDHKYIKSRDPSLFKDFFIPEEQKINQSFYKNATKIIVLSKICKEILIENNISDNVASIGCSLWSDSVLDLLNNKQNTEKKHKFAIVDSQNPIKGRQPALQYCIQKNISPHLIGSNNYEDFLFQLAECENLIFFPQVLETFSRLAAEAKMLNCKLITNPKMLGFASEDYIKLNGRPLVEKIRDQRNKALKIFEDWCTEE